MGINIRNVREYFAKRDADVMCSFGVKELNAICKQIENTRAYDKRKEKVRILEFGCGSGMAMIQMKQRYMKLTNIKGVDISPYAISVCKKRKLNCEVGNVEDLKEIPDNSYDIIYSQHVLEHTEPEKTINEAIRIAKKSIFIFPVGSAMDMETSMKNFEYENEDQKTLDHKDPITEESLKDVLRKVPNERHKIYKDIVTYKIRGTKHSNYMLVVYKLKDKEEVE